MASDVSRAKPSCGMKIKLPESNSDKAEADVSRRDSDILETKTFSGEDVNIEVTSGRHGEIRKLKIYECGNSIAIFHEEYDKLQDGESPIADPGFIPSLLSSLDISHQHRCTTGVTERHYIRKSEKKPKVLMRLQLEDDEGIVSKHATLFPTKIKEKDVSHKDVDSDYYYDMNSFPRGTFTLLNVRNFRASSGMSNFPRPGNSRDADGLCALFLELGFIVERYDNPTKKIMLSAMKIAASDEKSSCCACAILTHGNEEEIYASDSRLKVQDLTNLLRVDKLEGKPKLIIIQASQESVDTNGLIAVHSPTEEKDIPLSPDVDFLYAYSTVPAPLQSRNTLQGSWFIQAVCSVFREHADSMDVYRMLTRVNDRIVNKLSTGDEEVTQIVSIVSLLRKDFFLFPPYGPLPLIKSFAKIK